MKLNRLLIAICVFVVTNTPARCVADDLEQPYGIDCRIPWNTSRISGTPQPPLPYVTERIFPKLSFENPVDLIAVPGTNQMLVVEIGGKLWTFPNHPDATNPALAVDIREIPDAAAVGDELQLYGFAFHPDFERNRQCFMCYRLMSGDPEGSRVSRFRASSVEPLLIDPVTEEILITWRGGGHNGGSLQFGPQDGLLYISTGDGSPGFPPDIHRSGQDISDLLASVLRIDIDRPSNGLPYSVPADNPFVNRDNARGEVWTYGHRNPWRMSFDQATGDLWIGDVGWEMWEMIYRAEPGANFGWSLLEHTQPVHSDDPRGPTPITPPAAAHSHTVSRSITGGYVYRGNRLGELTGSYVYGDYVTGKIWGLNVEFPAAVPRELADTTLQIVCFGVDHHQRLYIVDYDGTVHRLVTNTVTDDGAQFPISLSETGLFASTSEHQLAAGVIPYNIIAEPWADGTTAQRFIALPGESSLGVHEENNSQQGNIQGEWSYPDGAVLGKTMLLRIDAARQRRLETQILHRNGDQWEAYNYLWNDEQSDAHLATGPGVDRPFDVRDSGADGGIRQQTWHFASRTECILCHTTRGGSIYGFRPAQLNRDFDYGSVTDNQLRTLAHIGLFSKPLIADHPIDRPPVDQLPRITDPFDSEASLTDRARSYLHVNCGTCHRRGGGGTASIQLVDTLSLDDTGLVARPTQGTFGIVDPWIVAPGDPDRSVLYYRMSKLGRGRMPHFGSQTVDVDGIELVCDWICQLDDSDKEVLSADAAQLRVITGSALEALKIPINAKAEPRQMVIDRLLSSTTGALTLATAVRENDENQLAPDSRSIAITRGGMHPDATIRDLFEPFLPEQSRVQRLGTTIEPESVLSLNSNVERGRMLFLQSQTTLCRNCHRVFDQGKAIGPDLTGIGARLSRREILINILDPSRKIDPKYQTWLVQTESGQIHSGLLIENTDAVVVIRNSAGKDVSVSRDDIELLVAQKKSLMPELLLRDATAQDAADLLAFVASLK
ncbi:MAG: PQQ-dependent sugar dehydrogenase [Fuerstiella sp.]|nr:PQQ-dependent sugar dehydrogenase [Fuerstiella sp.]